MAAITRATIAPADGGTALAKFTLADEEGTAVTPNDGCTWSLYNQYGAVINSRSDVAATEATTTKILLSGNDLLYSDGAVRKLVFKGTYDSINGSNLPFRHQLEFSIADIVGV